MSKIMPQLRLQYRVQSRLRFYFPLCSQDDINDACSETLLLIFIGSVPDEISNGNEVMLNQWFYTTAKRKLLDILRKKKKFLVTPYQDSEEKNTNDFEDKLSFVRYGNNGLDVFELAELLPAVFASLILKHYHEGYSLKEIALMEGRSYDAIRQRHTRAIQKLRTILNCPANIHTKK